MSTHVLQQAQQIEHLYEQVSCILCIMVHRHTFFSQLSVVVSKGYVVFCQYIEKWDSFSNNEMGYAKEHIFFFSVISSLKRVCCVLPVH